MSQDYIVRHPKTLEILWQGEARSRADAAEKYVQESGLPLQVDGYRVRASTQAAWNTDGTFEFWYDNTRERANINAQYPPVFVQMWRN